MDHIDEGDQKALQMPRIDEAKYKKYEQRFLLPPKAVDEEIWEVLADEFEALTS
jgi:hypothetical protein